MDKSEIRTNQTNGEDRQLKGLLNRGQMNFECADCGELLLVLQLADVEGDNKSEVLTRVAVQCDLCGGCSYSQQVPGQFYPGAPNDQMAFDIADDDTDAPETDVLFRAWSK